MHDGSLVDRLSDELSGLLVKSDMRALCLTLLRGQRTQDHGAQVDAAAAEAEADRLYEAGEAKWGTSEEVSIALCTALCTALRQ